MNLRYYYGRESEQFTFFRIPKQLFSEPAFKTISADAKILYGLLLDRMSLSQKSGWLDSDNRVYIVFPISEIQEQLGCCRGTAIKLLDELDAQKGGIGLIERVRRGLGQPSIIYVKNFNSEPEVSEEGQGSSNSFIPPETRTSRSSKNGHQDVQKSDTTNTDSINTYKCDTESIYPSIYPTAQMPASSVPNRQGKALACHEIEQVREQIKQQIEYDVLAENEESGPLIEIVNIMTKVLCSVAVTKRISGEDIPIALVKDAFLRLRANDIEGVISAFRDVSEPIQNPTAYITSMLYHAPDCAYMEAYNRMGGGAFDLNPKNFVNGNVSHEMIN